uniref:Secreted protein n=1 Tax=Ascaris lumbricoides TaxID=6252 RepID=A0A0M3I5K1_ASCLU
MQFSFFFFFFFFFCRDSNEKCTRREHQDEYQNKIEDTNCSAIDERTYEESPTLNPPISLQCCDANSNQRSTTRNALLSDFLGDDSIGYQSTSAKKPVLQLRCTCGYITIWLHANYVVGDAHALIHFQSAH